MSGSLIVKDLECHTENLTLTTSSHFHCTPTTCPDPVSASESLQSSKERR
jgi:hypothetical protein